MGPGIYLLPKYAKCDLKIHFLSVVRAMLLDETFVSSLELSTKLGPQQAPTVVNRDRPLPTTKASQVISEPCVSSKKLWGQESGVKRFRL